MCDHYKEKSTQSNKIEFTKLVIGGIMIIYFLVCTFGSILVLMMYFRESYEYSTDCLKALFTFAEIPIPIAIGFYCWKARGENIPKQYQRMLDDIKDPELKTIFLSSIAGGNLANMDLTKNRMGKQYNEMVVNEEENVLNQCKSGVYEATNLVSNIEDVVVDEM